MHKHINTKTDIIQVQWKNKSFTGNIYDTITKTTPTRESIFLDVQTYQT